MEERRQAILRELEEKGKVRVADLSKELGVSDSERGILIKRI